jgi:hypothetical protein
LAIGPATHVTTWPHHKQPDEIYQSRNGRKSANTDEWLLKPPSPP